MEDALVMKIIDSICNVLGISQEQVFDAFGEYWMCSYAPQIYSVYYRNVNSAKDFLLNMDKVHCDTTKSLKDATPPRFEYEWRDEKTLVMKYKSERGLIDLMVSLIKGVGKYFKEDLKIRKLGNDKVEVVFK